MTEKTKFKKHSNALATCCNGNWLPYAAATLLSCVRQGSADITDAIIVVCDVNEDQIKSFNSFLAAHDLDVKLIIFDPEDDLYTVPTGRVTVATLLRLKFDSLLPSHYERVLYLDCDIQALAPLNELLEIDLEGNSIGAVVDYIGLPEKADDAKIHLQRAGIPLDAGYFNSGIMIMDWQKTLKGDYLKRALNLVYAAVNRGAPLTTPDQDALNLVFQDSWLSIPLKFNLQNYFSDFFPIAPVFRHFTTQYKPWQDKWAPGYSRYRRFYVEAFDKSDWRGLVSPHFSGVAFKFTIECLWRKIDFVTRAKLARFMTF
jgi:lipopolysaccharide biosynthesis glycosyltransferase